MASTGKHVAYYRVSTQKQGRSGLGLEAQREAVKVYLNGGDWTIVDEYTEIETGKRADRPALTKGKLSRCAACTGRGLLSPSSIACRATRISCSA